MQINDWDQTFHSPPTFPWLVLLLLSASLTTPIIGGAIAAWPGVIACGPVIDITPLPASWWGLLKTRPPPLVQVVIAHAIWNRDLLLSRTDQRTPQVKSWGVVLEIDKCEEEIRIKLKNVKISRSCMLKRKRTVIVQYFDLWSFFCERATKPER